MKSSVLLIAPLLSGCLSTVAEVRQAAPTRIEQFPTDAKSLAWCTHQGLEASDSPYAVSFIEDPIDHTFVITATRTQDVVTMRHVAGMEVRFAPVPPGTRVELREGVMDGWWLSRDTWPLIEACSQRLATAPPPAAVSSK